MAFRHLAGAVRSAHERESFRTMHARGGPSANTLARYAAWKPGDETWQVRPASFESFDLALGLDVGSAAELFALDDVDTGVVVANADEFATVVAVRVVTMLVERLCASLADSA